MLAVPEPTMSPDMYSLIIILQYSVPTLKAQDHQDHPEHPERLESLKYTTPMRTSAINEDGEPRVLVSITTEPAAVQPPPFSVCSATARMDPHLSVLGSDDTGPTTIFAIRPCLVQPSPRF